MRADKLREVQDGHDGTWVAHPGLVPVALEIFDAHMTTPNQIQVKREDVRVTEADLLRRAGGHAHGGGAADERSRGRPVLGAWLLGTGCVPLYNLMEDAATAEISRTQVWQWVTTVRSLEEEEGGGGDRRGGGTPLGRARTRSPTR